MPVSHDGYAELLERLSGDDRFQDLAVMIFTERPDEETWRLALKRTNCDIQLKEELDLLPFRMRKFIDLYCSDYAPSQPFTELQADNGNGEGNKILLVDYSPTVCAKCRMSVGSRRQPVPPLSAFFTHLTNGVLTEKPGGR